MEGADDDAASVEAAATAAAAANRFAVGLGGSWVKDATPAAGDAAGDEADVAVHASARAGARTPTGGGGMSGRCDDEEEEEEEAPNGDGDDEVRDNERPAPVPLPIGGAVSGDAPACRWRSSTFAGSVALASSDVCGRPLGGPEEAGETRCTAHTRVSEVCRVKHYSAAWKPTRIRTLGQGERRIEHGEFAQLVQQVLVLIVPRGHLVGAIVRHWILNARQDDLVLVCDALHAAPPIVGVNRAARRRLFGRKVVLRHLQDLRHAIEQTKVFGANLFVALWRT